LKVSDRRSNCPLCSLTDWVYRDDVCWITYCPSHPEKLIVVLKRHGAQPSVREMEHIIGLVKRLYPRKRWKLSDEIKDHFHIHEI